MNKKKGKKMSIEREGYIKSNEECKCSTDGETHYIYWVDEEDEEYERGEYGHEERTFYSYCFNCGDYKKWC